MLKKSITVKQALKRVSGGMRVREAAHLAGVRYITMLELARVHGLVRRGRPRKDDLRQRIRTLHSLGLTPAMILKKLRMRGRDGEGNHAGVSLIGYYLRDRDRSGKKGK